MIYCTMLFLMFVIFFLAQSCACLDARDMEGKIEYPALIISDLSPAVKKYRAMRSEESEREVSENLHKNFQLLSTTPPKLDGNGHEFYLEKVFAVVAFKDLPDTHSIAFSEIQNLSQDKIKSLSLYNIATQTSSHVFGEG